MIPIKVGAKEYVVSREFASIFTRLLNQTTPPQKDQINSNYRSSRKRKEIVLSTYNSIYRIVETDVIYCHSQGNYTTFHLEKGERIMISKSMKVVEKMVSKNLFVRCHQSYMVNANFVEKYNRNGVFVLTNGEKVPVSARRKNAAFEVIFGISE